MGPVEVLRFALSEEIKAINLYKRFFREHPQLEETFSFLINEEERHKQLLENKIAELTR